MLARPSRVFIVDLSSESLCRSVSHQQVIMTHFLRRRSVSLSPVLLFIVFLLPLCQSQESNPYTQLDTTMADEFTCPLGGQWYVPFLLAPEQTLP